MRNYLHNSPTPQKLRLSPQETVLLAACQGPCWGAKRISYFAQTPRGRQNYCRNCAELLVQKGRGEIVAIASDKPVESHHDIARRLREEITRLVSLDLSKTGIKYELGKNELFLGHSEKHIDKLILSEAERQGKYTLRQKPFAPYLREFLTSPRTKEEIKTHFRSNWSETAINKNLRLLVARGEVEKQGEAYQLVQLQEQAS